MGETTLSSVEDCLSLLRQWREDGVRRSDAIVEIWEEFLSGDPSKLGDERYMVIEQVAVAAMDTHRTDIVDRCLGELKRAFDLDSVRVRRLFGMRYEMLDMWDKALAIYDDILKEDDSNSSARKRKIAILKARGDNVKAIAELNRYLKDFMSDAESWMELCELYIAEQELAKAAFCCEELILQNPNNHIYFQRYAEVKFTQGGFENMEMAKTYYAKAVTLNSSNMRALYGLLLTSTQLASSPRCPAQKKREHLKTVVWSETQISKWYEEKRGERMPACYMEGLLGQVQVQPPIST